MYLKLIPTLMMLLFSWRVSSDTYVELGVTELREIKLKYTWIIENCKLLTLVKDSIFTDEFWLPGNENSKWILGLKPQSDYDYMALKLYHKHPDMVHANYKFSIGSVERNNTYTFAGNDYVQENYFIKRDEAFQNCLPNDTLVVNCEIASVNSVFEATDPILEQKLNSE